MLTSAQLLASINLKGALPEGRFQDDEILDLAYEVLISDVQPLIIGVREEYFTTRERYPIIAGKKYYPIPSRAAGSKLREVKIIRGTTVIDLPQIGLEDLTTEEAGEPRSFFLESNNVALHRTPAATQDELELAYFLRSSRPVSASQVAVVTAIDGGELTASCPSDWTIADSFDIVDRRGSILAKDLIPIAVTSTSITLPEVEGITTGVYVCRAGESYVLQLPEECIPLWSMLTVVECLNSLGDAQAIQLASAKAEQLRGSLVRLLTARVLGAPRRFTPQV